ncbi:MAG: aminotransferase [Alphaproteobacteria bacterium]|nr:aminotransferase [Alphaproteobacteria bacterium]
MPYRANPLVLGVAEPPIAEAQGWIEGRTFPPDRPLLNMAQAVPSYPPATGLQDHLAIAVHRPAASLYTDILGVPALRAALAAHMGETYGAELAADDFGITAGCNQAFCVAMSALAGPGDEVILPAPWYFNHQMWLQMQGVTPVSLHCDEARGAMPDPGDAAALIGERTRAIVLVTPNNPTGAIYSPELIGAFYDLARERNIALVLDETYKDFMPGEQPPHLLFARPDWRDVFVQLYSFSKAYSLTGYRVGSLAGGPAIMGAIEKIMDCIAICAPRIGQEAALYGLGHLAGWRAEKRNLMQDRTEALRTAFRATNSGYQLVSSGAYFAWVRHPFADRDATAVARMLATDHNLLCLPGGMFGPGQDNYLRLAFANLEADRMGEVVARLAESVAEFWPLSFLIDKGS